MKEETKMEKSFSVEKRAEAVAQFAEAMNREDIDGFVFGVSYHNGTGYSVDGMKGTIVYLLSDIFVDLELDPKIFFEAVLMLKRKEADND